SDQYALGCVFFEMLTGQTPFGGKDVAHYAFLHSQKPAPSPRQIRPEVPRDVETICLKCLEKEPGRRYAGCQDLADDLRRWLDGEPVQARRASLGERLVKWSRRNPAVAALTAAVAMLLFVGTVVAWGLAAWALGEAKRATENEKTAKDNEKTAQDKE